VEGILGKVTGVRDRLARVPVAQNRFRRRVNSCSAIRQES
jgi:hypothetical protein